MKNGSDNFRDSSILGIMEDLIKSGKKLTIFEPNIEETSFYGCVVENDFFKFSQASDLIIANRLDDRLNPVKKKVFTRDIFNRD
jgi:UDPglucose 6-dehydrogenase